MYSLPHTKNHGCVWPIMGAGDSCSQACSSCASYHWAYRDQQVMLVTIGSEQLVAVKAMTGVLHPGSPHWSAAPMEPSLECCTHGALTGVLHPWSPHWSAAPMKPSLECCTHGALTGVLHPWSPHWSAAPMEPPLE